MGLVRGAIPEMGGSKTRSKTDPEDAWVGSDSDPVWIRFGSDLDPLSTLDPFWIRFRSDFDPFLIRFRSARFWLGRSESDPNQILFNLPSPPRGSGHD